MAEAKAEEQQRKLDELKGKNVAHYSVMLAAYINARVDANKAIIVFSSTGIGLLIAIVDKLRQQSICVQVVYIGALVAFFVAVCSTLLVHVHNAKAIESYIRNEGNEKSMDFKLKTWKYINYISFAVGLALSLVFTIVGIFNSRGN
jgi:pyruvate/2-oxoacid:ferredoxin oxidoreductase alpha subunit